MRYTRPNKNNNNNSTTSTPSLAQRIHAQAAAQGASTVDAPVSGGDIGAKNAALSFMIGGDAPTVEALRPLFDAMGKNVRYMGGAGKGQHTKMASGWEGEGRGCPWAGLAPSLTDHPSSYHHHHHHQQPQVNQILISTNMIGVVEGLLYAQKAGLDLEETIAAVGAGAAGCVWGLSVGGV